MFSYYSNVCMKWSPQTHLYKVRLHKAGKYAVYFRNIPVVKQLKFRCLNVNSLLFLSNAYFVLILRSVILLKPPNNSSSITIIEGYWASEKCGHLIRFTQLRGGLIRTLNPGLFAFQVLCFPQYYFVNNVK